MRNYDDTLHITRFLGRRRTLRYPQAACYTSEEVAPARLRAAELTGRLLGSDDFVTRLEDLVQRRLRRQKAGRKAKVPEGSGDLFAGMDGGPAQSGNT